MSGVHIILSMNYLKSIKPFELITKIVQKAKQKVTRDPPTQPSNSPPDQPEAELTQEDYADAQSFLVSLRKVSSQRQQSENILRRKIDLFQKIEIEPHYLSAAEHRKMLDFQFHLGSDIFLERVEHLQNQNMAIAEVMQEVVARRKAEALAYLSELTVLGGEVEKMIAKIAAFRGEVKRMGQSRVFGVWGLVKRKNVIKNKLKLLRKMKQKNELAFIQIGNIDQAFATEQSRAKLYDKIKRLTELERTTYICIVRNKLVATAARVKQMVEKGIEEWLQGHLQHPQIEKIVVLVYYIMEKDVYRENGLLLDLGHFDKARLRDCISKIFEWQTFSYVKNVVTREKINEFLTVLLARVK